MTATLEAKIDSLSGRLTDVSTAVSVLGEKLDDVRLAQAKTAMWCDLHGKIHDGIADDIAGLEGREREATGRVDVPPRASHSDAPRKGVRIDLSRVTVRDVIVAVALVVSLVMGGSAAMSGDDDRAELMREFKKIARVVADFEAVQAAALPAPPEEVE
jgi:hypothetical protein